MPTLDSELVSCAHSLIETFILSFMDGASALSAFETTWLAFETKVQNLHHALQRETLEEIHSCVSIIGSIASGLLSLDDAKEMVCGQLSLDLTKIMDEQMGDLIIRDEQLLSEQDGSNPVYAKPCHDWLLSNLHDPYPSKAVKKSISRQTGTSIKNVESWFVDARKRIGWNNLRKTYFANKQDDIVDAATRIFKPSQYLPPKVQESSTTYVDHHLIFTEMQQRAINLYDVYPEASAASSSRGLCQKARSRRRKKTIRSSYPSPERTPDRSPSPRSCSSVASFKRRRASPDSSDTDDQVEQRKRPRIDSSDLGSIENHCLPSPAPSLVEPDLHDDTHPISKQSSLPIVKSPKRKRQLSDAGNHVPVKKLTCGALHSFDEDHRGSLGGASDIPELDWLSEYSGNVDFGSDIPPAVDIWMPNAADPLNILVQQYDFLPQLNEVEDPNSSASDIGSISYPNSGNLFSNDTVDAQFPDSEASLIECAVKSPLSPYSWPMSGSPVELGQILRADNPYFSNIKGYSDIPFGLPHYKDPYYNTSVVDPLYGFTLLSPPTISCEVELPSLNRPQVLQECNSNWRLSGFGETKHLKRKRIVELRKELQQLEAEIP